MTSSSTSSPRRRGRTTLKSAGTISSGVKDTDHEYSLAYADLVDWRYSRRPRHRRTCRDTVRTVSVEHSDQARNLASASWSKAMKLWQWDTGRQGGGYSKLLLAFSKHFRFDCYILLLPRWTTINQHVDPSPPGFEHHRVNITLWKPKFGGLTFVSKPNSKNLPYLEARRAYHFRPDIQPHSVSCVFSPMLVLFSFGWLKKSAS